eukprot:Seg6109.2 transcript_id=Seg6109.2/GoldUCD/mRNA.D3Y31 product="putative serine/threonine-protein kinase roco6" protein_id=Seg6109.2/GoldUCD/D3Y31
MMQSPKFTFKRRSDKNSCQEKVKSFVTENFTTGELIGEGSAARTFKGKFNENEICVKRYKCDSKSEKFKSLLAEEANTLILLRNERIIACHGLSFTRMSVLMEYACYTLPPEAENLPPLELNNLRQLIEMIDIENEMQLNIAYQVASAMSYLHSRDVVHCDLKSSNILLTERKGQPFCKLGDFGISRMTLVTTCTATASNRNSCNWGKGTLPFLAPEVLTENNIPRKSRDVYAFAMVLHELANPNLSFPWEEDVAYTTINKIEQFVLSGRRPTIPANADQLMISLMQRCWHQEADLRPTFDAIVNELKCHDEFSPCLETVENICVDTSEPVSGKRKNATDLLSLQPNKKQHEDRSERKEERNQRNVENICVDTSEPVSGKRNNATDLLSLQPNKQHEDRSERKEERNQRNRTTTYTTVEILRQEMTTTERRERT